MIITLNKEDHETGRSVKSEVYNSLDFDKMRGQKKKIIIQLKKYGLLSNHELSEMLRIPLSSVCARINELKALNIVISSGKTKTSKYGTKNILWTINK
jgi:predicted transcriptional regulator